MNLPNLILFLIELKDKIKGINDEQKERHRVSNREKMRERMRKKRADKKLENEAKKDN